MSFDFVSMFMYIKCVWWELHQIAEYCFEQILAVKLPKHRLYGHLPPISQIIRVRWTSDTGHCWRSRDELICELLLHIDTSVGWQVKTYLHQLCADIGCRLEDLPRAMNDKDRWRMWVKGIYASSMTMMIYACFVCVYMYKTCACFFSAYG